MFSIAVRSAFRRLTMSYMWHPADVDLSLVSQDVSGSALRKPTQSRSMG